MMVLLCQQFAATWANKVKVLADAKPSWTQLVVTLGRWEFVSPKASVRMAGLCQ